jgi:ribose 1,5-bisphosphokinase PhnN
MLDPIRDLGAPVVLIDGIRSDAEVEEFRRAFPGFVLVGVDSSFETRWRRLRHRGRSDDLPDAAALRRRDERELGWGLGAALDGAEMTVENEGSLSAYCAEVRALLVSLAEGT